MVKFGKQDCTEGLISLAKVCETCTTEMTIRNTFIDKIPTFDCFADTPASVKW